MESQIKCSDTISENTHTTSGDAVTPASIKWYTLSDLHRLTFKLGEQAFNVEEAPADRFQMFVMLVAGSVKNVDVTMWHLEDRRDFINALKAHCLKHKYQFPLTEKLTPVIIEN